MTLTNIKTPFNLPNWLQRWRTVTRQALRNDLNMKDSPRSKTVAEDCELEVRLLLVQLVDAIAIWAPPVPPDWLFDHPEFVAALEAAQTVLYEPDGPPKGAA